MSPEPVLLIANPIAGGGRGRRAAEALVAALRSRGVPLVREETTHRGHARELAAAARSTVVAIGGDGTVHEVVDGLPIRAGRLGPLAVLPCGSGDDWAKSLRLGRDPVAVAAAIARGTIREIDIGEATFSSPDGPHRRRFANAAGLGLDAEVAAEAAKPHRIRGRLLYFLATLRVLRRLQPFRATIRCDAQAPRTAELTFLSTCNGQFVGGGLHLVPDGRCDDGRLDAVELAAVPRRTILWLFARLACGRHRDDPRVRFDRVARLQIDTDRPVLASLDGEVLPAPVSSIAYSILPERLSLLVP
ncbi:MAG: diacylglycerol kinase family lipid kinase [Planctomycetes bacterium]|nr:diacylglycerol kinase family lipid kinase [Planctomycetota bacterium]